MERKGISKKTRFEVFKRDKFTCQYCGRSAPDVILVIDHINPVANGGETEIINLVTACKDCNAGKAARILSDDTVIKKQKKQLDELQERREQLEAMSEWHSSLRELADDEIVAISNYFTQSTDGRFSFNENGELTIKRWLHKYSISEIYAAIDAAVDQYIIPGNSERAHQSVENAIQMVPKICASKRRLAEKPYLMDLYYIRGIIRKRMYCNEWRTLKILEQAYEAGAGIDDLKQCAIDASNWTDWTNQMCVLYGAIA